MTPLVAKREPPPVEAIQVYAGFRARFRKATGGWEFVCVNGDPQVYPTQDAALLAAWAARDAHMRGHGILSTGERAKLTRIEADKLFPGKGRCVRVENR